jgi:hypothetical protein
MPCYRIPLCVYELVAFSLACWKSFSHLRDVWRHSAIHRVLTIMSRDSILYFAVWAMFPPQFVLLYSKELSEY